MGQVRHACATTTHAVRTAIQRSQASTAALSRELGIDPKTVAKWRKRETVEDRKTGPKEPRSTVLSEGEEAMVVAFRRYHYDSHDQLRTHLADFMAAYNFARRLKALSGLTPYEYICKIWTSEPDRFIVNPIHQMPGLNT
ncbi:hypothetical protein [Paracoccus yeei]|uniref:IS481 family transposase n=1 Tax=Paracoccus yeei TaxID=147645 RepID=A0A2D2C810_9RHOB|nr:hypothetical protein [Paracoccus yeei]ATQ58597.1 hypothetical protein PYTT13_22505 [Paracoccus yeei]